MGASDMEQLIWTLCAARMPSGWSRVDAVDRGLGRPYGLMIR